MSHHMCCCDNMKRFTSSGHHLAVSRSCRLPEHGTIAAVRLTPALHLAGSTDSLPSCPIKLSTPVLVLTFASSGHQDR